MLVEESPAHRVNHQGRALKETALKQEVKKTGWKRIIEPGRKGTKLTKKEVEVHRWTGHATRKDPTELKKPKGEAGTHADQREEGLMKWGRCP